MVRYGVGWWVNVISHFTYQTESKLTFVNSGTHIYQSIAISSSKIIPSCRAQTCIYPEKRNFEIFCAVPMRPSSSWHPTIMRRNTHFLHDRPWISPWIKSISNELGITIHMIASELSRYCDVVNNGLWRPRELDTGTICKDCRFCRHIWIRYVV